jgi:hypothetical protein
MHVLSQPLFAPRRLAGVTVGQLTVAALSVVAAGIHAYVVPEHYEEYWLFGLFFAVVAFAQGAWAAAVLYRPTRLLRHAGVALSAGLLALWALSRTAGLPLGPERWHTEPVELLDIAAGAAELGIIVVAAMTAGRRKDRRAQAVGAARRDRAQTRPMASPSPMATPAPTRAQAFVDSEAVTGRPPSSRSDAV